MVAADTYAEGTPRGWLAVLFGGQPSASAAPSSPRRAKILSPQAATMLVAAAFTEERMRAATSGFEMGEYEPLARRN